MYGFAQQKIEVSTQFQMCILMKQGIVLTKISLNEFMIVKVYFNNIF